MKIIVGKPINEELEDLKQEFQFYLTHIRTAYLEDEKFLLETALQIDLLSRGIYETIKFNMERNH